MTLIKTAPPEQPANNQPPAQPSFNPYQFALPPGLDGKQQVHIDTGATIADMVAMKAMEAIIQSGAKPADAAEFAWTAAAEFMAAREAFMNDPDSFMDDDEDDFGDDNQDSDI